MSFFARLLSPSYRRGLIAEAAGDLEGACRAFAKAGRTDDVLRVRRLLAAATGDPAARIAHLRAALALTTTAPQAVDGASRGLQRDLGRALLQTGSEDPAILEEAAECFTAAGEHLGAADALLALGRISDARRALAEGRHFERLEQVDREEADRTAASSRIDAALSEAREALAHGRRTEALGRLLKIDGDAHVEAAELAARITEGRSYGRIGLALGGGSRPVTCLGELPLILGRGEDSPLPLRDAGISRHHARIVRDETGDWILEDLESRNGTFIEGIPIAAPFPLAADTGRFALGEQCRIAWSRLGGTGLLLTVERGLSAGARALAVAGEVELGALASQGEHGARLSYPAGWFVLSADAPTRLCGLAVEPPVVIELLSGDEIEVGGLRVEVRSR